MRGFFSTLTVGLILVGFLAPVAWAFALITGIIALVAEIVAIGSAPSGRRADGKPRTGGLLGDLWDDWAVKSTMSECPTCRTLIRRDAAKCPHCQEWVPKPSTESFTPQKPISPFAEILQQPTDRATLIGIGVVVFVALALFVVIVVVAMTGHDAATKPADTGRTQVPSATISNGNEEASAWIYNETSDQMHDTKTRTACTVSLNQASLTFPYHDVNAELCVRRSPRFGLDAFVALQGDGQILCDYESCSMRIRFDKDPIRTFPAVEAADHSTNILFIRRTASLLKSLKKSSKTIVELNFYQNGVQELSFNTAKFVWN